MPIESDESTLRLIAREAIRAGKLPNRCPERTWGGRGADTPCAICGERVKHDEVEFELEFAPGDDDSGLANGGVSHHVHLRCFAAWELERKLELQNLVATRGEKAVSSRVLSEQTDDGRINGRERDTTGERGSS